MANERTQKNCYESRYGGGYINAANFLVELICEKIASKRKTKLPQKFWKHSDWTSTYKNQILHAHKLVKTYPVKVITEALKDYRAKKIYSLGARFILVPLIEEKLKSHQKIEYKKIEPMPQDIKPRKKFSLNKKLTDEL